MDRARRDQKVVVLLGREPIHIRLSLEGVAICLSCLQFSYHGVPIYLALSAKIDASVLTSIQKVIALVLGVFHPEFVPDVLGLRVNLQREVATSHGIEELETNREASPE